MPDVEISVGGNLTPFKQAMAETVQRAKDSGKEAAEKFGLEFGNRGDMRQERRLTEGLSSFINALAGAKDPIGAVSGAVEGLGKAFMITGPIIAAVGIGAAIYEQFTKAREATQKLDESLEKSITPNVDLEPVNQLKREVADFQKIEEQYANRGMLERIMGGAHEDSLMNEARALNDVKKSLIEIDEITKGTIQAEAKRLSLSDNPEDKKRGSAMLAQSEAETQVKATQDALNEELKLRDDHAKAVNDLDAKYAAEREVAKKSSRRAFGRMNPEDYQRQRAGLMGAYNKTNLQVALRQKELEAQTKTAAAEQAKINAPDKDPDAEGIEQEKKRQDELTYKQKYDSSSDSGKAQMLRDKIKQDQYEIGGMGQTRLERERAVTALMQDQLRLSDLLRESQKKQAEQAKERASLLQEQSQYQGEQNDALNRLDQFDGQVTSARRIGFGATPTGGGDNKAALDKLRESNEHLKAIRAKLETLEDISPTSP